MWVPPGLLNAEVTFLIITPSQLLDHFRNTLPTKCTIYVSHWVGISDFWKHTPRK